MGAAAEERPGVTPAAPSDEVFGNGAVVIVSLASPREKFFGVVRSVAAAGVSVTGLDLNSIDDFVRALRAGEPAIPATVFFPMHRVERIDLDKGAAGLPSVRQRLESATERDLQSLFGVSVRGADAAPRRAGTRA
ncbi:MAG TPA: hypothetical protein VFA60_00215 [Terriglobales bacterium]|nr:hypothetical protein [Terriglobales bacterium]